MHYHAIDWSIMAGLVLALTLAALATRRHAHSVSGFLAGNRSAGRYLISMAFNMSQLGVITLLWYFQIGYDAGFTSIWWGLMENPVMILIALSGWVIYRFRRTRALTLAQFFEMRYSRRFRIFAGLVAFASGLFNYGIFPGVAARFFMALCGLPEHFSAFGLSLATFPCLMLLLLSMALFFVFIGGQLAIMVTDFLQGVFCNFVFLAVILFLLLTIPWHAMADTFLGRVLDGQWVAAGAPDPLAGRSVIDPFDLGNEDRFNIWYWIISVVVILYGMRAWQGDQGYNAAARTPHEARMANILNGWRFRVLMLITIVLPLSIRTWLHHPMFAAEAAGVRATLEPLAGDPALLAELRTPIAATAMLPVGLLGLFGAAMLGAFLSTNDTYLHSWGAIFVQDVVLPFRKRPLSPARHLALLRGAIFAVAVFAFVFSWLYEPSQYISMYLALTGAIFVGGAGSAIIGGLYWKKGTAAGAWSGMIVGMSASGLGIVLKQTLVGQWLRGNLDSFGGGLAAWGLAVHESQRVTGQVLTGLACAAAILTYVAVSRWTCREDFDLDRLLHRGRWAVDEDRVAEQAQPGFLEKLGFTREFTGADRWITWVTLAWPLIWTGIFLALTVYALTHDMPREAWLSFWHFWTWLVFSIGSIVWIWLTLGGLRDLREMFRLLRTHRDSPADDGRV